MEMPWYANVAGNFFAGITLSFGDRLLSHNASRFKEERIKKKLEAVESMKYIIDVESQENSVEIRKTEKYIDSIETAKGYFRTRGLFRERKESNLVERMTGRFNHYKNEERLNNLPVGKKLGAAFGIELSADAIVAVAQMTSGIGHSLTALGHTLYQGPALFLGLATGKGLLYVKDLFKNKSEKEIDQITKKLTVDGKILGIVQKYSSTARLQYESPKEIEAKVVENPKQIGKELGERIASVTKRVGSGISDGITSLQRGRQEKRQREIDAETARQEEIKKRYDRY